MWKELVRADTILAAPMGPGGSHVSKIDQAAHASVLVVEVER
jgi:hypothetical protein